VWNTELPSDMPGPDVIPVLSHTNPPLTAAHYSAIRAMDTTEWVTLTPGRSPEFSAPSSRSAQCKQKISLFSICTDCIPCCAGTKVNIPAGAWIGIDCREAAALVCINWLTIAGGCQALHALATLFMERDGDGPAHNARARGCYDLADGLLKKKWMKWVYFVCNEAYGYCTYPFSFDLKTETSKGVRTTSWRLEEGYKASAQFEAEKGKVIASLAGAARIFCESSNKIAIKTVPSRQWGRLTKWCQANMGPPKYTKEWRAVKGAPRPHLEESTSESE
jgi:hypothetical protein